MHFVQYYPECLSQASYLVGDDDTGRAVVVDPRRDVEIYLDDADAHGLRIERVIETHIHADFLSGHLELAAKTGAAISYGEGADVDFPIEPLRDGEQLRLGDVTLEVLATPGHTPESISVVVRERTDDAVPLADPVRALVEHPEVGEPSSRLTVAELEDRHGELDALQVVDVRNPGETAGGVIPGAANLPLPQLTERMSELDPTRPTVVYCASGYRSSIGASVLAAAGFDDVSDLLGGYDAWKLQQAGREKEPKA
jgi:rhodanese-related sulfurtransferase